MGRYTVPGDLTGECVSVGKLGMKSVSVGVWTQSRVGSSYSESWRVMCTFVCVCERVFRVVEVCVYVRVFTVTTGWCVCCVCVSECLVTVGVVCVCVC